MRAKFTRPNLDKEADLLSHISDDGEDGDLPERNPTEPSPEMTNHSRLRQLFRGLFSPEKTRYSDLGRGFYNQVGELIAALMFALIMTADAKKSDDASNYGKELMGILEFSSMTCVGVVREIILTVHPDLICRPALRLEALSLAAGLEATGGISYARNVGGELFPLSTYYKMDGSEHLSSIPQLLVITFYPAMFQQC